MQNVCEGPEGLTWLVLDHLQRLEPLSVSCGLQEDDPTIGQFSACAQAAGQGAHRAAEAAPAQRPRSVRVCPLCRGPECAGGCGVACHSLAPWL